EPLTESSLCWAFALAIQLDAAIVPGPRELSLRDPTSVRSKQSHTRPPFIRARVGLPCVVRSLRRLRPPRNQARPGGHTVNENRTRPDGREIVCHWCNEPTRNPIRTP